MVFTNVARNQIRNWMSGGGIGHPIAIAWGTGTTVAAITDTALEAEVGSANNAGSIATGRKVFEDVSLNSQEITYTAILTANDGSGTTFAEIGIFSTSGTNTGSLYARTTYPEITKTSNEEWTATYIFKLS
jgi:hypothetical protein